MANIIDLPLLSDTMTEGTIADVLFKVGDKVSSGDTIAEVETDKATLEVDVYDDQEGVILHIANAGDVIPVGGILAITGKEGEDISNLLANGASQSSASQEPKEENKTVQPEPSSQIEQVAVSSDDRVKASPLAKKMATDNGLNLANISGSGDNGRIVKKDIEVALAQPQTSTSVLSKAAVGQESFEEIPVTQIRKTIAKRLAESKFGAPHFYLSIEVVMDQAMKVRQQMNEVSSSKISFNDLVMKATAVALNKHPYVNASWLGDKIRLNHHVHIGMAVAIPEGLVVPVLKFADTMPLSQLAATSKEMAGKAREGKLSLDEMQGGTFSVSNLGGMGIDEFTAIINPPNAAILAVGGISKRMREVNGEMKAANVMKVTLSCDHRVVDGAVGSAFLNTFKQYLENPAMMLV